MLVAKDRVSFRFGCSQLTKPSNSLPTVAGRPCQGAVYGRRYWPGIHEFFAGAVQRPWHQLTLQSPLTLMMAKAGKFAVWFGCHNGQRCWYSWRAPVLGPSVSNGNRVGGFCVLVPFAIR